MNVVSIMRCIIISTVIVIISIYRHIMSNPNRTKKKQYQSGKINYYYLHHDTKHTYRPNNRSSLYNQIEPPSSTIAQTKSVTNETLNLFKHTYSRQPQRQQIQSTLLYCFKVGVFSFQIYEHT